MGAAITSIANFFFHNHNHQNETEVLLLSLDSSTQESDMDRHTPADDVAQTKLTRLQWDSFSSPGQRKELDWKETLTQ
jgi:hypothetical protein